MSDHDYGIDDLQPQRPDDLATVTTRQARWLAPVACVLAAVALNNDRDADRSRERDCVAASGKVVTIGRLNTCLVDGVNVARWNG